MVPKGEPGEGSSLPQRSDHFADFAVNSSAATQVSRESISSRSRFHLPPLITRVKHSRRDPDSSGRSLIKGHALPATGSLRVAAACGSPRPLLVGKHQTIAGIGTAIQHDTISQCSQITQKCRSLTFHIHIRDGTGTVTPTDHVLHGDRRQVAQGHAREPSPEYGEHVPSVPAGGKYSESPRRCQGRGRGPAEKRSLLHKRTCAKLFHAAASHHRGPCAVAQPLALPMPASCPPCPDCPTTNSLLHKRTCAKLVHAAASHHRGPCAVAQPLPMPASCPPWPDCPTTNSQPPRHHA